MVLTTGPIRTSPGQAASQADRTAHHPKKAGKKTAGRYMALRIVQGLTLRFETRRSR
jgi:hypothetical protein